MSQEEWGFNRNDPDDELNTDSDVRFPSSDNQKRDYHYIDYTYEELVWDADNEIWKSNGGSQHHYGTGTYLPECINDAYNQGEPGAHYPDHEDYNKGKEGYLIVHGKAVRNYLSHEFKSIVSGADKYADLKAEAIKEKKNKFHPYCLRHGQRYDLHDRWLEMRTTRPIRTTSSYKRAERRGRRLGDFG